MIYVPLVKKTLIPRNRENTIEWKMLSENQLENLWQKRV